MNKSGIEWCDHTWNPITGCRHNCEYCYARRMVKRFSGDVRLNKMMKSEYSLEPAADGSEPVYVLDKALPNETGHPLVYPFGFEPTYHKYRNNTLDKLKMGNNIFVGAMADIFGEWVPESWIEDIFIECRKRPQHNYIFLTKNPERYKKLRFPIDGANFWFGTSVTCGKDIKRIRELPAEQNTFVSLEPLHSDLADEHRDILQSVKWIIIGAETGNRKGKVIPLLSWVLRICKVADVNGIPVFMKDSLIPIVGEDNLRRDYPEGLINRNLSEKLQIKLYAKCNKCGKTRKKSDMMQLLARTGRGIWETKYGFLCRECFEKHCRAINVDASEIYEKLCGKEQKNEEKL